MSSIKNTEISLCITLSIIIASAFLWHFWNHNSGSLMADAAEYQRVAKIFREQGWLSWYGTTRTYAYPSFLAGISFFSGFDHRLLSVTTGLIQYILFVIATLTLFIAVNREDKYLAWAILYGLLLNPLALGLVTDALTEGLCIPLVVLLMTLAVKSSKVNSSVGIFAISILAGLVLTLTLMVRPASITIVLAWYVAVFFTVFLRSTWRKQAFRVSSINLVGLLITAGIILTPQIYYNLTNWHAWTFFPVCKL